MAQKKQKNYTNNKVQPTKQNVIEEKSSFVEVNESKKKYLVVLSCPKYTIIKDENGHNKQIMGDYGVEIGGYIEL